MILSHIVRFLLIFHEYAIHEYANEIICMSDSRMKYLWPSSNLIPNLIVYEKEQLRYDWLSRCISIHENHIMGCH